MPKRGTTNPILEETIKLLKKTKRPVYKAIAEKLEKPRRKKVKVNVWKINKYSKEGDTVVVPGKVLAQGELDHKIIIAAFSFSKKAGEKLGKSCISIPELVQKNPKGSEIKILM